MGFIFGFWNIGTPARHKLYILEISLLPFELEVAVDGNVEGIQEPVASISIIQEVKIAELTTTGQPFPSHLGDFVLGVSEI